MGLFARDVMQHDVKIIDADASLEELENAFLEAGVSGFPVVEHGSVVGVITRSDVVAQLGGKPGEPPRLSSFYADLTSFDGQHVPVRFSDLAATAPPEGDELRVSDLMTPSTITVAPDASLESVARTLVEHHVHRVLVTDAGTLVGIISSLDLCRLLADGRAAAR